jgi:heme-degrading monooxygenase HmoA
VIVEVGLFRIDAARADDFAPVAADIRAAFEGGAIAGLGSFHMAPAVEDAGRWAVLVAWASVDEHRRFVESPEGRRQQALLASFMTDAPEVFHLDLDDVKRGLR